MVTSSVRLTGDTSGLVSSFEQVGEVIDREREKIDEFSDSIKNIPTVTANGPFSNANVTNAINNQSAGTQGVQQQTGGNGNGGGGESQQGGTPGNVTRAISNGNIGGLATSLLTKAGLPGLIAAGVVGGVKVASNVEKKWEDKVPDLLDTYNSFSDVGSNTAKENSDNLVDMYSTINNRRKDDDVRFKNDDYIATMRQMREYGYGSTEESLKAVSNVLKFENAGMGTRAQLMEVEGTAKRFGQENALNQAYAGLEKSGMEKGQFDEFLSGMQQIFEDGISKGIVKGYDEIATDLTLLENLSGGNKLWQGQYGATNLQQMNSAVENATNLNSVNDVVLYQAVAGLTEDQKKEILGEKYNEENGYVNNMMILEKGITKDTIGPILKALSDMGGAREEQIARLAKTFGFDYSKAVDLYGIAQNFTPEKAEETAREINGYVADTRADSTERETIENRESVAAGTAKLGENFKEGTNFATGVAATVLSGEDPTDRKEVKRLPVSGDELSTWNKLIESYNGPKEVLYQRLNDYFYDDKTTEWADKLNFQESGPLKEAWDSGDGNSFFTTLFSSPKMVNTPQFGPMAAEDWTTISKDKSFKKLKKLKKAERDEVVDRFESESKESIEALVLQRGMLSALTEIANFVNNGKLEVVESGY